MKRKIEYHFEFTGTAAEIDAVLFFKKLLTPTLRNSLKYTYREEEMAMMTVNEVSKLTGVSIRTLQYYDTIGLLKPIQYTESGYRLYDDTSLERLQQILLFKELEFPLRDIKWIVANEFMQIFVEFGKMKEMNPADEPVQLQVRKLQDYIMEHFYTCSDKVLCGLGRMYAGGGELTENIDAVCGAGTAEFASKAIDIYYMSRR